MKTDENSLVCDDELSVQDETPLGSEVNLSLRARFHRENFEITICINRAEQFNNLYYVSLSLSKTDYCFKTKGKFETFIFSSNLSHIKMCQLISSSAELKSDCV